MGSVTIGDQLKPDNANLEQQLDLPTRVTVAANCIQTEKPIISSSTSMTRSPSQDSRLLYVVADFDLFENVHLK